MANEIHANYESGNTLYAVVRNKDGEVWYVGEQVFEAWGTNGRDAGEYSVSLTDKSGSLYIGSFDISVPPGRYCIQVFLQAGASPSDGDSLVENREFIWSGTGRITSDKLLVNKAMQNKSSGQIQYYDDDGQTVLVTFIPSEDQNSITRIMS